MPRRLIDSRICGSDKFNTLPADFERVLYLLLITNADAYGREEASPLRIKSMCFPARDVKPERIEQAMKQLHECGLCVWYDVDGKMYYQITRWDDFQCFNSKNRRYNSTFPMHSAAQCGTVRHCDNSECESNREGECELEKNTSCPMTVKPSKGRHPKISFSYEEKKFQNIKQDDIDIWKECYPAVDIVQQLREMRAWLLADKSRQKVQYKRFITSWLAKEQDKGGARPWAGNGKQNRTIPMGPPKVDPKVRELETAKQNAPSPDEQARRMAAFTERIGKGNV